MSEAARIAAANRWSGAIRSLHWLTVAILGMQLFIAFVLMGGGMKTVAWLPTHLTLGFSLLAITAARAIFLFLDRATAPRRRWFVRLIHLSLYVALFGVLATGWLSFKAAPFSSPPMLFGIVPVPRLRVPGNLPWPAVHRALVWILIVLVGLHVAAAGVHFLVLRDRVLQSMKPWG